jgi:MYXO-CTERM domain-containing protein
VVRRSSLAYAAAAFSVSVLAALPAAAQGEDLGTRPAARADELTALEGALDREHTALATADCVTACRALASIRRAADRICALDPDDRCVAARAKADDAVRRVREACPECAVALAPPQPAPPMAKPASNGGADSAVEVVSVQATANAPPSESRRGGCAGCTTTGTSPGDLGTFGLALSALAFVMRRRRSTGPRA